MRIIKLISVLCVITYGLTNVYAQVTELNFKSAVSNAVNTNINVIKAQNSIDAQTVTIKGKYGALLPTLSFQGSWQRSNQVITGNALNNIYGNYTGGIGNYGNQIPGSLNQTGYNYTMGLRSDLTIFNGFNNYQDIELSKKTRDNDYILLEKAKQDIVLQILSDFITVLRNQQIVIIDSTTLDNSRQQLYMIKQFVEAGKKTIADIYNEDALVAQNELVLEQAKNGLDKSISDLIFDANLQQDKAYSVASSDFSSDLSLDYVNMYVQQN